jgi:hypothetical protein
MAPWRLQLIIVFYFYDQNSTGVGSAVSVPPKLT